VEQKFLIIIALLVAIVVIGAVIIVLETGKPISNPLAYGGPSNAGDLDANNPLIVSQIPGNAGTQNANNPNVNSPSMAPLVKTYTDQYSFYTFEDPNEGAFTIKIPTGWQVMEGSGLIRPYIDAGVMVAAQSDNQEFIFISPVAAYAVPNSVLDFAGFTEGTYYDVSGGIAKPMLVARYMDAQEYLEAYIEQLSVTTQVLEVKERPDLTGSDLGPLITRQSATEMTYLSNLGPSQLKNKVIAYTYLVESNGMGIWVASMFGYSSAESLFNETEYLVLRSAETLKVDPEWAKREAQEMNERLGIIASTQESISETISSTFEYRSDTMDAINEEWSDTILGIEEVYDSDTGEMHIVDSGARYYWIDDRGTIYGTDTYESPLPLENLRLMQCPGCGG